MSGYNNYEIDLTGIATVEQFHQKIRQGLKAPDYYGDNLDALSDLLSEMSGRVIIKGSEVVDDDITSYIDTFRALCSDAQANNPLLEIVFA